MTETEFIVEKEEHKDYQLVDILKFIFCLCIIGIHTGATPSSDLGMAFFRLGVPFFFVSSGLFLGKKVLQADKNDTWKIVKRYCLRLLKPFLVFTVIDFLIYFIIHIPQGESFFECLKFKSLRLPFYPGGALWYVAACMVGALLLIPFLKFRKINLALIVGIPLYGFSLLCNNYYFIISNTRVSFWISTYLQYFISGRNGLFVGFPLLAIGIKCAQLFFDANHTINKKFIYLLLFITFVIYAIEVYLISKFAEGIFREDAGYFLSQLILMPCLLLSALLTPVKISTKVSRTLRDLSVGLYFLHSPLIYLIGFAAIPYHVANFFIVLSIGLVICLLTYKFKKEPLYSLLR